MAKSKKKLPRKIAGVKVPKALRKSGASLLALVDTPTGRRILADALIAAAGALVANREARRAVAETGAQAAHAVGEAGQDLADAGARAGQEAAKGGHDLAALAVETVAEVAHQLLPSSPDDRDTGRYGHLADRGSTNKRGKDRSKPSKH